MALKSTSFSQPWSAKWQVSSSSVVNYSGENIVSRDNLDLSVSDNPGGQNPFESFHLVLEGSRLFCPKKPTGNGKYCVTSGPSDFSKISNFGDPGYPDYDPAHIWSATNPSRPVIHLPVFWLELREVPDMLRQAGRFLLAGKKNWKNASYLFRTHTGGRDLATANLAYQFGWTPLIGDLWKIVKFQDAVDKRRTEINRLYEGKGLRRRISIGTTSANADFNTYLNFGSYRNFYVNIKGSTTRTRWAVVRWKPTSPSSLPPSDGVLRAHLTGVHPSHILENVWEALPWSWLIDYFTNIGDNLQSMNHHLATPAGGSLMTETIGKGSHGSYEAGLDRLSGGTLTRTSRSRYPLASSSLSAKIPNLGASQLSVLSSLAFLRLKR